MKNKSECLLQSRWKSCCCNCVNRVRLLDNDNNLTQVGYGCKLPLEMGENWVSVGDFEHGMCECHEPLCLTKRAPDAASLSAPDDTTGAFDESIIGSLP